MTAPEMMGVAQYLRLRSAMNLAEGEWGFLLPYGIGDALAVMGLVRAFLEKHGGKRVVLGIKASHAGLLQYFPGLPVRTVLIDYPVGEIFPSSSLVETGWFRVMHPHHVPELDLPNRLGKSVTLFGLFTETMGLPADTPLERPVPTEAGRKNAEVRILEAGGRTGTTVILAPGTQSTAGFPSRLWEAIAKRVASLGWTAMTNLAQPADAPVGGTRGIHFPLAESIETADAAGWVISARSGFCDVVATTSARFTVLYPRVQWYGGTVLSAAGLREMRYSATVEEHEIAVDDENEHRSFVSSLS